MQVDPLSANPTKWSNTLKYITNEDKIKEISYLKNYYQKNLFDTENHGRNILLILGQNKRISLSFILKSVILKGLLLYAKNHFFSSSLYRNNSYIILRVILKFVFNIFITTLKFPFMHTHSSICPDF